MHRVRHLLPPLVRAALAPSAIAVLAAACGAPPVLSDVAVTPGEISPNADGAADVAQIAYAVGVPADLTIDLVAGDGAVYRLRDARPRSPGGYVADFGGVVDGRMLPDGAYTVRLTAVPRDAGVMSATVTSTLTLAGGDRDPPVLAGFAVQPEVFTPNQDGLGDRVAISYRLDAPADVRLTLVDAERNYVADILEDTEAADPPGLPGPKQYDYDAGVDADAPPPPDGRYYVVGEARDAVGNVSRVELPLEIRDGGQPRAAITGDVAWSATVVPLGDTLAFTVTVENIGDTPIRTRGPEPGFVYANDTTFNQQLPAGYLLLARSGGAPGSPGYRAASRHVPVGDRVRIDDADVDLAARRPPAGDAPAIGTAETPALAEAAPVVPGALDPIRRVTLCGTVRDGGRPVAAAEVFAFEVDGDRGQAARTGDDGRYCFDDLAVPTPAERTYARSPGAIRLGLEYDESRIDLEYPFRWQLGATTALDVCESEGQRYLCLPPAGQPGARVQITGGVRFVDPPYRRVTNVYLALMHEDVRRMHGPYGIQRVTVEY